MKRILTTAVLLLGLAPAASAAPFGELGFRPAGGTAACLRATGFPGELVRSTADGAQFLQAGAGGLTPVADVASEARTSRCPQAAARPNGAGIVAFAATGEGDGESFIRATLREPGAGWGTRIDVTALDRGFADGAALAADISERGDALVAFAGLDERRRIVISAARRDPGAGFGAVQTLMTSPKGAGSQARVAAGVTATGDAVVAWSFQPVAGKPRELWAAIAPAGAPFGAPVKFGKLRAAAPFSLAVGAGGQALLAFVTGDDVVVAERAPGGGFGPPTRLGTATDRIVTYPVAAVRADGGAIVAWANALDGDVHAVLRTQAGPFGAPVALAPKSGFRYPKSLLDLFDELFGAEDPGELTSDTDIQDDDSASPRALITPDGRAVVTWGGPAQRDGLWWGAPRAALIALGGGAPADETIGTELREVASLTALTTAEGAVGVAWADNGKRQRDGRVHFALEGAATTPDASVPEVTVIAPKRRVLKADEALRFGIRCSAACDVRVQVGEGVLAAGETFSLKGAGEQKIRLDSLYEPIATLRGGPVKVLLRYGAPGARAAAAKTVTYRLRRLPDPPRPKVLDAVARRDGKAIVVTWRTDRDAQRSNFSVYGTKTRDAVLDAIGYAEARGSGRRFHARLVGAEEARYVQIVTAVKGSRKYDTTNVRVRG